MTSPTPHEMVPKMVPRLEVSGLAGRYGTRTVFSGVTFTLTSGDCLAVVGSNGAGKSTLLRILAGLVRPYRGTVSLGVPGAEETCFSSRAGHPEELGRRVGLASLDVHLYEELTAAENLAFFGRLRGLPSQRSLTLELLSRVGLAERADDRLSTFSSGMKQRLRLLFALQHTPFLLLMDEPGSNLDPAGRDFIAQVVEEQLKSGILVLATNDPEEVGYGQQVLELGGRK